MNSHIGIDFVVLWVDPNDKKWQKTRYKYAKELESECIDNRESRYRDWELFKYWFRGVEKFAPWVDKIHLVTYGHVPKWLNTDHPKLNIVKHSDFMPKEALPTFNTNAIELSLHRIPGLSEQFVLFNDDVFILKNVKPTDFFKKGLPVNTMALFAIMPTNNGKNFHEVVARNVAIINKHFDFAKVKKKEIKKYLSLKQREWVIFTYPLLIYNHFVGFRNYHVSNSYLKKTYRELWKKEPKILEQTVSNRFRNNKYDVSDWLINYWQFAKGDFLQRDAHFGISLPINNKRVPKIIAHQRYRELCLNDVDDIENCDEVRREVSKSFEEILSDKSSFEK